MLLPNSLEQNKMFYSLFITTIKKIRNIKNSQTHTAFSFTPTS